MSDSNMDLFNSYAGKILECLYSRFPKKINLDIPYFLIENNEEQLEIFCGTIEFLDRENFLIYNKVGNEYTNVCLTSKGLSVLNATPESINEKEPFITKIRSALKSCGNEVMKTAIQGLIRFGISQVSG